VALQIFAGAELTNESSVVVEVVWAEPFRLIDLVLRFRAGSADARRNSPTLCKSLIAATSA